MDKRDKVIIRADGGTAIGMGHVVRSLALGEMVSGEFEVVFAIQNPNNTILQVISQVTTDVITLPETSDYDQDAANFAEHLTGREIVVLDGYQFRTNYQKKLIEHGCKVVAIDDLHLWQQAAHVVINHAGGVSQSDYEGSPRTLYCLGPEYALLRSEFLHRPANVRTISAVSRAFISMGASDTANNTMKFAQTLLGIATIEEIHLMVSGLNPFLKEIELLSNSENRIHLHLNLSAGELIQLLEYCHVAICPASTISMECCAVGIGLLTGYTADNQRGILSSLTHANVCHNLGDFNSLTQENLGPLVAACTKDIATINAQLKNQPKLIDGDSAWRILNVFKKLRDE